MVIQKCFQLKAHLPSFLTLWLTWSTCFSVSNITAGNHTLMVDFSIYGSVTTSPVTQHFNSSRNSCSIVKVRLCGFILHYYILEEWTRMPHIGTYVWKSGSWLVECLGKKNRDVALMDEVWQWELAFRIQNCIPGKVFVFSVSLLQISNKTSATLQYHA